jgi:hypothetical protein
MNPTVYFSCHTSEAKRIKAELEETGVCVQILPLTLKGCTQTHFKKIQIKNPLPLGRSLQYIRTLEALKETNQLMDVTP